VVFCVDKESAAVAHAFFTVPVLASLSPVQVPVADYLHELGRVGVLAVAVLVVMAVLAVGVTWVVGVILGVSVGITFIVVAGCPIQRCVVVRSELFHG
jgi:hypothetical protein